MELYALEDFFAYPGPAADEGAAERISRRRRARRRAAGAADERRAACRAAIAMTAANGRRPTMPPNSTPDRLPPRSAGGEHSPALLRDPVRHARAGRKRRESRRRDPPPAARRRRDDLRAGARRQPRGRASRHDHERQDRGGRDLRRDTGSLAARRAAAARLPEPRYQQAGHVERSRRAKSA